MYLIDSNIIIYASIPEHKFLREFIKSHSPYVSIISKIEVLGYHNLKNQEKIFLKEFFDTSFLINISDNIVERAIKLRQKKKMTLGDTIIAATALENNLTILTRNVSDFKGISYIKLSNPME